MDKLPFFYYDILSRMTPGAVTLATLFMIPYEKMPCAWWNFFVAGQQTWKAVIVPLVLGGLCYAIGVFFEAVDYAPVMGWIVLESDRRAFIWACKKIGVYVDNCGNLPEGWSAEQKERLRFQLWDRLVFIGGRDPGMDAVFAHCHRFQAEHKMFLHLIYPGVLFLVLSLSYKKPIWWAGLDIFIIVVLFYLSHLRNCRRWLQVLSFCKQLNWIQSSVKGFEFEMFYGPA